MTRVDVATDTVSATVYEDDTGYGPQWSFTTFAICALPISGREIVETDLDADADGQTEVSWCDEGKAALRAYGAFDGGEGKVFLSNLTTVMLPQFGDASAAYTSGNDDDGTTLSHDMCGARSAWTPDGTHRTSSCRVRQPSPRFCRGESPATPGDGAMTLPHQTGHDLTRSSRTMGACPHPPARPRTA